MDPQETALSSCPSAVHAVLESGLGPDSGITVCYAVTGFLFIIKKDLTREPKPYWLLEWMSQDLVGRMGVMASAVEALGRLLGICKDKRDINCIWMSFKYLLEIMDLPLLVFGAPSSTSSAAASPRFGIVLPEEVRCSFYCIMLQIAMGMARGALKQRRQLRGGASASCAQSQEVTIRSWLIIIDRIRRDLVGSFAAGRNVEERGGGTVVQGVTDSSMRDPESWKKLSVLLLGSMQLAEQYIEFSAIRDGFDLESLDFRDCVLCWLV